MGKTPINRGKKHCHIWLPEGKNGTIPNDLIPIPYVPYVFFGVDCHHHDLLVYEPMLWCHHHKYSGHILAIWWRWCAWNIGIPQMGKGWPKLGPAGRDKMWSWWCELRSFSSQFHCVGCLALLPNKTSLPLDKAASNPTAIGESNCSLLSNCVDYFLFLEEAFHPCCFFKSRTRRVIISLREQGKTLGRHIHCWTMRLTPLYKNTRRSSKYIHSVTWTF